MRVFHPSPSSPAGSCFRRVGWGLVAALTLILPLSHADGAEGNLGRPAEGLATCEPAVLSPEPGLLTVAGSTLALRYAPGREIAQLRNPRVRESSGIAVSRRTPGVFWTHNDSGDEARAYAFDREGRDLGTIALRDIIAFDWEDMCSLSLEGKSLLLLADIGNNLRAAPMQMIHVVEEPEQEALKATATGESAAEGRAEPLRLNVRQTIYFAYEDDYRDCEALAVDPASKQILLATKGPKAECYVYSFTWPEANSKRAQVARKIARLDLSAVTGMDIAPDGRRAILSTYRNAYQFVRQPDEDWATAFAQRPIEIPLPKRRQGEAICYGEDGKTLYLTSEGQPAPLIEVPVTGD
ncbi:MAG: hypothetical protein ACOY3P_08630 [Planctomycetota bacterium]